MKQSNYNKQHVISDNTCAILVVVRNIEKALLPRKKRTTEKERFVIIKLPYIAGMNLSGIASQFAMQNRSFAMRNGM